MILFFNNDFNTPLTEDEAKALYDAVDSCPDSNKLAELKKNAELGDVWSMFYFARLYTLSNSVERNFDLAFDYYTKAANAGNAMAMNSLGKRYENGEGVKQDHTEAVKWYRKAADLGDSNAMFNLGDRYYAGDGVKKDYEEAVKWYKKAADCGNTLAMSSLSFCYESGSGVNQDYIEAVKWYEKAAKAGEPGAMYGLGYCYEKGLGVNKSNQEALKWYRNAADNGNSKAMTSLGYLYSNGEGVNLNYAEAANWYRKAADAGNVYGISGLAWCYEFGNGVEKSVSKALHLYKKSIENGREKDDWITERIKVCERKPIEVKIGNFHPLFWKSKISAFFPIIYTLETKNVERRTLKIILTLNPLFGGSSFTKEDELKFDQDGYFDTGSGKVSDKFEWSTVLGICGLNSSGEYDYTGKVSCYDENNTLLFSKEFKIKIKYKHKMLGSDEYEILKIE